MVTEAGIIGKIGFNSAGIGICFNALGSSMKAEGQPIPLHIGCMVSVVIMGAFIICFNDKKKYADFNSADRTQQPNTENQTVDLRPLRTKSAVFFIPKIKKGGHEKWQNRKPLNGFEAHGALNGFQK